MDMEQGYDRIQRIINTAPVISSVTISPGVTTSSTLTCTYSATDVDGDALNAQYA